MKTVFDHIRYHLLTSVGIFDTGYRLDFSREIIKEIQWDHEFIQLMQNRMELGAYRYNLLTDPSNPLLQRIDSALARLKLYQETGNLEHLVDVSNICMCEFKIGIHPKRHFQAADDGLHTVPG